MEGDPHGSQLSGSRPQSQGGAKPQLQRQTACTGGVPDNQGELQGESHVLSTVPKQNTKRPLTPGKITA